MAAPITDLKVGDSPFDAIPTRDGCWIFVSAFRDSKSGVVVLRRTGGSIEEVRFVPTRDDSGMVLTHDERLLISAAERGAEFLDVEEADLRSGGPGSWLSLA